MVTENINIDVRPGGVPVVIHVTQYEAGLRQFIFTPYTSGGTLTAVAGSATLEGTKPDGYAFQQACEMVDGVITYTLQEQLCAVEGRVWSRLVIRDINGGMIGYTAIVWVVGCAGVKDGAVMSDSDISALRQFLDEFGDIDAYRGALNGALAAVGGPLVAATTSAMTDRTKVYVYTGSETGYTEGHWYYWNGSAWTDGGVYQSTGINTDKTLTVEDMAADAKATGDAVAELKNDLDNLVVTADMIDGSDDISKVKDFTGYTAVPNSYTDWDGSIKVDTNQKCLTTGFIDFADLPDVVIIEFGATVEAYSGRPCVVIKNTDDTYTRWTYSGLPNSFVTKTDGVATLNLAYLKAQGTRSQIAFNLTNDENYIRYNANTPVEHKTLDWLDADYTQIMDASIPQNLYTKTCTAFGGSSVSSETATVTAVNQGILTNPFVTNSNMVRVKAKLEFTTPNVYVLMPYYANGAWVYGNILDIQPVSSGEEFTFDIDAAYYAVYHSAERFRLLFQTRSATGVSDYSGTIKIVSLAIEPLPLFKQYSYYDKNFVDMMIKVFNGIDDAKSNESSNDNIYVSPTGEKFVLGVGENNQMVMIPLIPNKTLFCGNSLLLGMNTTSSNHEYIYGMCATAPDEDYAHKVMDVITSAKSSAIYDRVHGAAFETLGTSDSFSTLWNTTPNTYTGEPLKNSFTSDLDLIIIQLSDNVNTSDRQEAFANNIDNFIASIRLASPNARLLWVYGWFYNTAVAETINAACSKWGIKTLNIRSLHTAANEAVSGQSYIKGDGTTGTVSDTWITHPGNSGFTAIAEAIVKALSIS